MISRFAVPCGVVAVSSALFAGRGAAGRSVAGGRGSVRCASRGGDARRARPAPRPRIYPE